MTGGLIDDEQWGFRAGRGCVDQIFTLKQIGEKAREKKRSVYVGFMDLEKHMIGSIRRHYGRYREYMMWSGKLLNGIISIYIKSSTCVSVKGRESECFKINSGLRQGYTMVLQCIYGHSDGGENGDGEEGSEISRRGKRVKISWPLVCR